MADLLWTKPREVGGVLLAPPTVRSFFRALEVFGAEIGAVREARSKVEGALSLDVALSPFLVPAAQERLRYVLEDVITTWTEPSEADLHAAARGAVEILGSNLARIEALLGEPAAEIIPQEGAGDDVLYILGCADKYHIDPRTVMDWPVGLFLDVVDAFTRHPAEDDEAPITDEYRRAGEAFIGSIMPTLPAEQAGESEAGTPHAYKENYVESVEASEFNPVTEQVLRSLEEDVLLKREAVPDGE
jgi:hypothetical protein